MKTYFYNFLSLLSWKKDKKLPYLIYSPLYDDSVGGVVALHQLNKLLNESGHKSYIWPAEIPNPITGWAAYNKFFERRKSLLKIYFTGNKSKTDLLYYKLNDRAFRLRKLLKNSIVVYPEVVSGNPLNSKNVVRWFLHKPGHHTGEINYGDKDLYFYFNPQFNDRKLNEERKLKVLVIRDDIFFNKNLQTRNGSCYILRKGKGRALVHDTTNSILVDNLSLQEIADVFNRSKYCISYDTQTLLSKYAAICGCISIVIPEYGVSKQEWRPNIEDRYGIAYGMDELDWAVDTQDKTISVLKSQGDNSLEQLKQFIAITQSNV